MKQKPIQGKTKSGETKEGIVFVPESFEEMETLLSRKEIFKLAMRGYVVDAKRKLLSKPRKRWLKLELTGLDDKLKSQLQSLGIIQED